MTWASVDRLGRIAREAGAAIRAQGGDVTPADLKADRSPVSEADRAAHRSILASLSTWDADIPAISEEGVIPPCETRRGWRRFWLIDPLDGTKEFLARTGETR